MEKASADEVEAVLAHELGHWARSHPTKLLCLSQGHLLFTFSLLHFFLGNSGLLRSFRFPAATAAHPPIIVAFLLSQLVMSPLDALFALTVNAVTRRFEYEADRFAVEIGGAEMGRQLQFALKRLHVTNASTINHDWLCVVSLSPTGPRCGRLIRLPFPYSYSAYHHSHPTLPERLRALDDFTADRSSNGKTLRAKNDAEAKKDL